MEGNALRAGLVARAQDWRWGGMFARGPGGRGKPLTLCDRWPVDRPRDWAALVNRPLGAADLGALRTSVNRGRPFGDDRWVERTARRLGLLFTLRDRGRPRKAGKE